MKSYLWILLQIWLMTEGRCSKLLKVPRIYNALITSDEDLLPSQAYPAVAPVLRPSAPLYLSPELPPLEKVEEAAPINTPLPAPNLPEDPEPLPSWDKFKNNRPADPEIPDVPPPPIPVTIKQGKL